MLRRIELPSPDSMPRSSPAAEALFVQAAQRIDAFLRQPESQRLHTFVSSDFRAVDEHLAWIVERRLAAGRAFCEWGSGFGVVTMLAALHGFDACGIEVEPVLIENARRLADDLSIEAQFVHGSLIPEDGDRLLKSLRDIAYLDTNASSAYDDLGLSIDDFDLFFVFPWPGEEHFYERLFERFASVGALLLTYHGIEGVHLQRRVR